MSYHCPLAELTCRYEKALCELREFKNACVQVVQDDEDYETTPKLLSLIPELTEVYLEYHNKQVEQNLSENEFY